MLSGKAGVPVLLRTEKKRRNRRRHVPTRGGCCELAASAGNYGTGDETLPADARCVAPRAWCSLHATGCRPRSNPVSENRPPPDLQRTSCVVLRTEGSRARPSIRSAPKRRCALLPADGSLHCRPAARRGPCHRRSTAEGAHDGRFHRRETRGPPPVGRRRRLPTRQTQRCRDARQGLGPARHAASQLITCPPAPFDQMHGLSRRPWQLVVDQSASEASAGIVNTPIQCNMHLFSHLMDQIHLPSHQSTALSEHRLPASAAGPEPASKARLLLPVLSLLMARVPV